MTGLALLGFLYLAAAGVWESTDQRPDTSDEARTLAAVFAALIIASGAAVLTA